MMRPPFIHQKDIVIFDVDDTLGFFTNSFDRWLSKKHLVDMPDRDVHKDYNLLGPFRDIFELRNSTSVEILEQFEATGHIESPEHFLPTSVVEFAKGLLQEGVHCIALTARGWMKDGKGVTEEWLKNCGISMPVNVLGLRDSKANWINEHHRTMKIGRKVWVFEDNPEHIKDIDLRSPRVEGVFVVNHPHNSHLPKTFHRVDPHSTDWVKQW
jgi:hypothetical protein